MLSLPGCRRHSPLSLCCPSQAAVGTHPSLCVLPPRLLELHSPDGQHTVVLRCKDAASAQAWFTATHTNIAALLPQTLAHVNAYLSVPSTATHPQLKHIGWLAEQVSVAQEPSVRQDRRDSLCTSCSHIHSHVHTHTIDLQEMSISFKTVVRSHTNTHTQKHTHMRAHALE